VKGSISGKRGLISLVAAAGLAAGCQGPWVVDPGPIAARDCEGAAPVSQSVYLLGDAGAPSLPDEDVPELVDPVLLSLHDDVAESARALGAENTLVLVLGDNVYFRGLVPPGEKDRRRGERILEAQIAASEPARVVFLAGNHDWDVEGAAGWDHVTAQRDFLAQQGPRVSMQPPGGCAGPAVIDLGRHLRFVLIDPIGYSHVSEFPDQHDDVCPYSTLMDAYLALAEEFQRPEGRHVVLALHHPLITAGPHGGHFTWKQHLFPLTDFWPDAWVPLPVIGSLYPLSRMLGVTTTDLSNREYQRYIRGIYRASTPWAPMLVAAGHEHSLQVHRDAVGLYYAVSGAGSVKKVDRVEPVPTEMMAIAAPGYMRLDAHSDGAVGLTVLAIEKGERTQPVFRHCLATGPPSYERRPR
jgi:hypothetical protein